MALTNTFALLDKDFLIKLNEQKNRKILVKIISLNWDEEPLVEMTGNIVSGSINVDGKSKVRRTCNLTLVTRSIEIDNVSWSLNTKFKVEIGIYNEVDEHYADIIWFPQGMYIITSFSSSLSAQGYTINIQGKDKMCLINGDISGELFAAHEFSKIYTYKNDGSVIKEEIPIYQIIREAVHQYAQEPYHNIIINDLDTCGVELLDYVGDNVNLYIFDQFWDSDILSYEKGISYEFNGSSFSEFQKDGENVVPIFNTANSPTQILFGLINGNSQIWAFEMACSDQGQHRTYNLYPFKYQDIWYVLHKRVTPTDDSKVAGYRATDITYPNELTIAIGGTITEMLDKLIEMLGEFEYFYDVQGRFIFQRKKIYFNSSWSNAIVNENQTYYDSTQNRSNTLYDFVNSYLIESIQNKPNLSVIRNDFSIWGSLKTINGTSLPIHLRYAIDHKPSLYYSLLQKRVYSALVYDWRELIYRMALDNLAAPTKITGLTAALASQFTKNPYYHCDPTINDVDHYDEYYKYDLKKETFVQLKNKGEYLICITNNDFLYTHDYEKINHLLTESQIAQINERLGYNLLLAEIGEIPIDERNIILEAQLKEQYKLINTIDITQNELDAWQDTFNTGYDAYFTDMLEFWPHLYRTEQTVKMIYNEDGTINTDNNGNLIQTDDSLEDEEFRRWQRNNYWNPVYVTADNPKQILFVEPEKLFFWIDFIDSANADSTLQQFSVQSIGRRSKAINDDKVRALYFRETPLLLFVSPEFEPVKGEENLAYARINLVSPYTEYFRISSQGKSAKEVLDTMLYEATYFQETINLSSIPIYDLEPNTRISIHDSQTGIGGEYIVQSFSIQLAVDGFMSITANRAANRII